MDIQRAIEALSAAANSMTAIVNMLNERGYEIDDGDVTAENADRVVAIVLEQLSDAVERDAPPAPVKLPEEHGTVFIGGVGVRVFSEPAIIAAIKSAGGEVADE